MLRRLSRRPTSMAAVGLTVAVMALAGCGSDSGGDDQGDTSAADLEGAPSWCGPKKITLGLTDGFGGNSWRLVTTASAKDEITKCPSVTDFTYADGFDFTSLEPAGTCRGITVGSDAAGTPLYPERIKDGFYQLPGTTDYYGDDKFGSAVVGGPELTSTVTCMLVRPVTMTRARGSTRSPTSTGRVKRTLPT